MNNTNDYIFTLKLTSNVTDVNLPYIVTQAKNLKILSMSYTTAGSNYLTMAIRINGFNNNYYYDGVNQTSLVKAIYLPTSASTNVQYYPVNENNPDVSNKNIVGYYPTKSLYIEILIDSGSGFAYQGVSSSYPVYIEIHLT